MSITAAERNPFASVVARLAESFRNDTLKKAMGDLEKICSGDKPVSYEPKEAQRVLQEVMEKVFRILPEVAEFDIRTAFYGMATKNVLAHTQKAEDMYAYSAWAIRDTDTKCVLYVNIPTKALRKADNNRQKMLSALDSLLPEEGKAAKYDKTISNVSRWAISIAKWGDLRNEFVPDPVALDELAATEGSQTYEEGEMKAVLLPPVKGSPDGEYYMLKVYVPGVDPHRKLTEAISKRCKLPEEIARTISLGIRKLYPRGYVEFRAFDSISQLCNYISFKEVENPYNLANEPGENPVEEVAAILRQYELGGEQRAELLYYVPASKRVEK